MDVKDTFEWTPPTLEETRVVRLGIEGHKFVENIRDEQRSQLGLVLRDIHGAEVIV